MTQSHILLFSEIEFLVGFDFIIQEHENELLP